MRCKNRANNLLVLTFVKSIFVAMSLKKQYNELTNKQGDNMEKLEMATIIGKMMARQNIVKMSLETLFEVYKGNIPAHKIEETIKMLSNYIDESQEEWENRA